MKSIVYSQWKDTAKAIHLVSQMMGKVKLARMSVQPAWQQVVLPMTARGFTTGLIPNDAESFSISMDIVDSTITAENIRGDKSEFQFRDGASIHEYYQDFGHMLNQISSATPINTVPQETSWTTPFELDTAKLPYDAAAANTYFTMCVFAHNAIYNALSPLRAAKLMPALFWGTFDLTGVLFSGIPEPFSGTGLLNAISFDERMVEFGFWPGDDQTDEPSFFVLPYPFISQSSEPVRPEKAIFSPKKQEWFLSLRDVWQDENPTDVVQQFFHDAFLATAKINHWEHLDWITRPIRTLR